MALRGMSQKVYCMNDGVVFNIIDIEGSHEKTGSEILLNEARCICNTLGKCYSMAGSGQSKIDVLLYGDREQYIRDFNSNFSTIIDCSESMSVFPVFGGVMNDNINSRDYIDNICCAIDCSSDMAKKIKSPIDSYAWVISIVSSILKSVVFYKGAKSLSPKKLAILLSEARSADEIFLDVMVGRFVIDNIVLINNAERTDEYSHESNSVKMTRFNEDKLVESRGIVKDILAFDSEKASLMAKYLRAEDC